MKRIVHKFLLLIAGPLRPNPPPPLDLNGHENFVTLEKKVPNFFFSLMTRPFFKAFFLNDRLAFCSRQGSTGAPFIVIINKSGKSY